jgi:hypothetical protein
LRSVKVKRFELSQLHQFHRMSRRRCNRSSTEKPVHHATIASLRNVSVPNFVFMDEDGKSLFGLSIGKISSQPMTESKCDRWVSGAQRKQHRSNSMSDDTARHALESLLHLLIPLW